jgi:WD40 repeat protein
MQHNVSCPHCGRARTVETAAVGVETTCAECLSSFTTPHRPASPARSPAADTADAAAEPSTNRVGRFRLRRRLGVGSFGAVYLAYDEVLKRDAALKLPHSAALLLSGMAERFVREAQTSAQLRHPNIVPVFDAGEENGRPYIASAFIPGRTLEAALKSRAFDPRAAARLVMKLADALAYAHGLGIVHRDVKPANVMLDDHGEPYLMDFGIARWEQSDSGLTADASVMGTPLYMSPEQAGLSGTAVGPGSDQYALGVVLYELLSGRTPFGGGIPVPLLLSQIRDQEPARLRTLLPSLSRDLETICRRALAKRPEHRYCDPAGVPSCRALADDLRRFADGEPIRARRVGPVERAARWARRNPALAGSTGVAALLVSILAVVSSVSAARLATLRNQEAAARLEAENSLQRERDAAALADRRTQEALDAGKLADLRTREAEEERRKAVDSGEEARLQKAVAETRGAESIARLARSNYFLADARWRAGRVAEAIEQLDAVPAEYRGLEWRLLRRECQGSDVTLYGHQFTVTGATFFPDGTKLASSSYDGTFRIWDAQTGAELRRFDAHSNGVYCIAVSGDGTRLASAGSAEDDETTIKLWNARTGTLLKTFPGHGQHHVADVEFSADGLMLVSAGWDGTVRRYNIASGEVHSLTGHQQGAWSLVISPDGSRVASVGGNGIIRLNTLQGVDVLSFRGEHKHLRANAVAFSPDGRRLAGAFDDGAVKLWDATTGRELRSFFVHDDDVDCVAFSPDGTRLALAGKDHAVTIWDLHEERALFQLIGHTAGVDRIAFSPDGSRVVSASDDRTIKIWDARTGARRSSLDGHENNALGLCYHPDGKRIVSGAWDHTLRIWDARTRTKILTLTGHTEPVRSVVLSPDGTIAASASSDHTIKLWDLDSGALLRTLAGHTDEVNCVAFHPDAAQLASASDDKSIRLWNPQTGALQRTLNGHQHSVDVVAYTPDGRQLVAVGDYGKARLWNITTGVVQEISGSGVNCLAFTPDSKVLATGSDKTIKLWDLQTGSNIRTLFAHDSSINALLFTGRTERLISAAADKTVKLWDWRTGEELKSIAFRSGSVDTLAISPDDQTLALGTSEGRIELWDAGNGDELRTFAGDADFIRSAIFTPDGKQIIASCSDFIRVWDAQSGAVVRTFDDPSGMANTLSVSRDGKLLFAGYQKLLRVWNWETGETVPFPAVLPDMAPARPTSADGRWLVFGNERDVLRVDLQFKDLPDEQAYRARKAQLDQAWHTRQGQAADKLVMIKPAVADESLESRVVSQGPADSATADWFAAAFHWAWVMKASSDKPANDTAANDKAVSEARDRLRYSVAKWRQAAAPAPRGAAPEAAPNAAPTPASTTNTPAPPTPATVSPAEAYLPPIVLQMLEKLDSAKQ